MRIRTRAGAKVFFFGEYAALLKGSAGLFSLNPDYKFEAHFSAHDSLEFQGLHVESPAAKYLAEKVREGEIPSGLYAFEKSESSFNSPGFGSSTVEYLTALALSAEFSQKQTMNRFESNLDSGLLPNFFKATSKMSKKLDWPNHTLQEYQNFATDLNQGGQISKSPSGYDLVAQNHGGAVIVEQSRVNLEDTEKFLKLTSEYTIGFFRTGRKLQTHSALRGLDPKKIEAIYEIAELCRRSLHCEVTFWEKFDLFVETLLKFDWTDSQSQEILERLRSRPNVFKAKACGAMGVDTILVVLKKGLHDLENLSELQAPDLTLVATNKNLASAFSYERIL